MDPKNQPQPNPPKEQTGFVPSAPKPRLSDVVARLGSEVTPTITARIENTPVPPESGVSVTPADHIKIIKTYKSDAEKAMKAQSGTVVKIEKPPEKKQEQPVVTAPPQKKPEPPQFNPRIPLSEILRQDQAGFVQTKTPEIKEIPVHETIVRTYESDAAEAAKSQQQSVVKIALAQEQMRREEGEEIGAAPKKKVGLLLTAIILITLGAAAIPTVRYILNLKKQIVPVNAEKTIIPFDHQETLTLDSATRDNFVSAIGSLQTKTPVASTVEYIKILEKILDAEQKPTTQKITSEVLARLIGPNMPSALVRSFDSDYMFGIKNPQAPKPFILFKTSSYQLTFANMLRWETKMVIDLVPVLNLDQNMIGKPFVDKVVLNKDVRAVTATDGTITFLYGFLDNQTLIIATDSQTFQDVNARYVSSRFVQ